MNIRTPSLQTLALTLLALSPSLTHAQSSNLLPDLTVSGDSFLKGTARFGVLGANADADGLRIDVVQSQVSRLRRVWHPATGSSWSELVPVWGDVDTGWDEEFGHTDYIQVELTPYIPGYYADEEYIIEPAIPAHQVLVTAAVPPTYTTAPDVNEDGIANDGDVDLDSDGVSESIVDQPGTPAVYDTIPEVPAVTGIHQVWIPEQPATYTTVPHWVVDYVVHHEQITYQIIGEERVVHDDTVPAHFSSELLAGDPSPVTRFTGTHPEMAFAWANLLPDGATRHDLMTLSSGGLLFPQPGDTWGYSRASLSQDAFEHSWTGPEWSGEDASSIAYHSYGSRMDKEKFKVWNHGGDYVATSDSEGADSVEHVTARDETTIGATGITIERSDASNGNGSSLRTTHITSEFANFGGSMAVKGVIRVYPAGDLEMGQFTNGPQP